MSNGPATPSKLGHNRGHSRQLSSNGGTEFGTPDSNFPTDSPKLGESTRMVGLGISKSGGTSSASIDRNMYTDQDGEDASDVFGHGQVLHINRPSGKGAMDNEMDEVDQFLRDEENGTRESSLDGRRNSKRPFANHTLRHNDSGTSSLNQSPRSHASDPLLEVLDNDEDDDDEGMELFNEDDEEFDTGSGEPGAGRRSRRGRRRYNEDDSRSSEAGLLEVNVQHASSSTRQKADIV
jgi:hypothetical protein